MTFVVRFRTAALAPPRKVSLRTPLNGWDDIEGVYVDGTWTFMLDETTLWTRPSYFKFVLDGRQWMDDSYIRIAPTAGDVYVFDEEGVSFGMTTTAPTATAASTPVPMSVPPPALTLPAVSEGAVINRVVLILMPFVTAAAAWVAGVIARHVPGVTLDQTQIVSFMIAIVAVCLASGWKWLQGWQQHELLVAQHLAAPLKAVFTTMPTATAVVQRGAAGT